MGEAAGVEYVCLTGPTACGKTELAVALAERVPLEIVSMDSALVYRGLDIGTAKPTPAIRSAVRHHLIDILDPTEAYSAGRFARDAGALIDEIRARGRLPLLVGGTLLYLRALRDGLALLPRADPTVRAELDREAAEHGLKSLHERLRRVDPAVALLAVFFNLVSIASEAGNLLNHHAPLVLLTGRGMGAADAGTLQALAYAAMRQQSAGYSLALTFFGGFCLAVAHLLYRATFLPRALGPLMALAGVGYVVHGFASFLSPTAGARVFGVVALPCFLGELGLALWLLGRGVDVGRWEALVEARRATSDPIRSA